MLNFKLSKLIQTIEKKPSLVFILALLPFISICQPEDYELVDKIYQQNIRSVKFHVNGLMTSYPIVDLNRPNTLELHFDDMQVEFKRFMYRIVHCNADWTASDLEPIDYLDGFEVEEIRDINNSFNTARSNYTHYSLTIPNVDMKWNVSGNYVLLVWDDEDESMVISRRFMVVEPLVFADIDMVRPSDASKYRTHHEFDFQINVKNIPVHNHAKEMKVMILQNGRWDKAIYNIKANFRRGDFLVYDFEDQITFPAGREFRNFDIRSVRFTNKNVFEIDRTDEAHYAVLEREQVRKFQNFVQDEDLNGQFVIHNLDNDALHTQSEYVNVKFNLVSDFLPNHDVYIFGSLTDWKIEDRFRMDYYDEYQAYLGDAYLKQGFYDYFFVAVSEDEPDVIDYDLLEGSTYQTENDYNFLVYYRPLNERYDRLVGVFTFNPANN